MTEGRPAVGPTFACTVATSMHSIQTDPDMFEHLYPVFAYLRRHQPHLVRRIESAWRRARRFRLEFVEPRALELEQMASPIHAAEIVLREAARHRLFTLSVPRAFGGQGLPVAAQLLTVEEISAGCVGIANLISVHGLALATITATGDLRKIEPVLRALVESERQGRPKLFSTALTEPGAGTDVEDIDLLRVARLCCEARPVAGGYVLNGRKVFISNGSIADRHAVVMPIDRSRPVETLSVFLVETGDRGFQVGRVERKMGQKLCPAAELVFEDCFVPEDRRFGSQPVAGRRLDLVLGATRVGVAAFGAGVARGAYERAVAYATQRELGGRPMLEHQWVQARLSDLLRNVMLARASYIDAMFANELFGLSSLTGGGPLGDLGALIPQSVLDSFPFQAAVHSELVRRRAAQAVGHLPLSNVAVSSAFGAGTKVSATDLAMENAGLALDLMGGDGLRRDRGVEKLYRDAKLLQIYEGTNQLNRLELYKKAIDPDATVETPERSEPLGHDGPLRVQNPAQVSPT